MNNLSIRKLLLVLITLTLAIGSSDGQLFHKNPEKALFGKTLSRKKEAKVKGPRSVHRAKRKQEANDRRLKRNYEKSVKRSQKRTMDIQTPEVKARMKQDKKTYTIRDRKKRKKDEAGKKRAAKY